MARLPGKKRPTVAELRAPRPNAIYHVYTHAVPGLQPLASERWRLELLDLIAVRLPRAMPPRAPLEVFSEIDVYSWAAMKNHAHMILGQGDDPMAISRFVGNVLRAFALRYNRETGHRGQVFLRPFEAKVLPAAGDVMTAIAYVHNNPKQSDRILEQTSHAEYVGARPPGFVQVEKALSLFGGPEQYEMFFEHYREYRARRD